MTDIVAQSMTLDEILMSETPPETFGALTSDIANTVADYLAPTGLVTDLARQLIDSSDPIAQQRVAEALTDAINKLQTIIGDQIAADLAAQQKFRDDVSVNEVTDSLVTGLTSDHPIAALVASEKISELQQLLSVD